MVIQRRLGSKEGFHSIFITRFTHLATEFNELLSLFLLKGVDHEKEKSM